MWQAFHHAPVHATEGPPHVYFASAMLSPAVETVQRLFAEMKVAALNGEMLAYDKASDSLATFVNSYVMPTFAYNWQGIRLSPRHRIIVDLLHSKINRVVSREALMDALYFADPDGGPNPKIIDVFIWQLRQKLARSNSQFHIETHWGFGYGMKAGTGPRVTYPTMGKQVA